MDYFNSHKNPMKQYCYPHLIDEKSTKRLNNLPKVTQLVGDKAWIQTQSDLSLIPCALKVVSGKLKESRN